MDKQITKKELKEMAAQLSCPSGEAGTDIANKMNDTNSTMTLKAIETLRLSDNDSFLEIGHGNCRHLKDILKSAKNIQYFGLDISELMNQEAANINSAYVETGKASFHLYTGEKIPFQNNSFHKIMTVNTIYFWKNPAELLKEIYRVLKNNGLFSIAFVQKDFMETLPFTKYGFELFDTERVEALIKTTSFKIVKILNQMEQVESKAGEMVNRNFTIVMVEKKVK